MHLNPFSKRSLLLWGALCFQAGYINAGGFLACHWFVSHITGFGTRLGVSLAEGSLLTLEMLSVPLFFIFGSMVSAMFIDRRIYLGKKPSYAGAFVLNSIMLVIVWALGVNDHFGNFGQVLTFAQDFELIAFLCFACGVQNASISTLTKNLVRTTHLTGHATDFGIHMILLPLYKKSNRGKELYRQQRMLSLLRPYLIVSFLIGSCVAAFVFPILEYWGFLPAALLSLGVTGVFYVLQNKGPTLDEVGPKTLREPQVNV